jgi:type II secretion system protein C
MGFVRSHRLTLELGLLALVAYLTALGVSTGLGTAVDDVPAAPAEAAAAPPAHAPGPLADYALIAERDVFNPARGGASGRHGALRLWGVGLQGNEARAVIEDTATRRQELYRVGDQVGGARIASIDWDRVTLEDDGGEEVLELSPPASAPAAGAAEEPAATEAAAGADERIRRIADNAFIVDRREVAGAADNMSGLMTQLRAVAEVRDGRPAGFRLFQIRDDSLFARLGLRNGDVVQRVNGAQVADPAALLGFLQRLRTEPRVALDIVRGDAPRTMVYDLR